MEIYKQLGLIPTLWRNEEARKTPIWYRFSETLICQKRNFPKTPNIYFQKLNQELLPTRHKKKRKKERYPNGQGKTLTPKTKKLGWNPSPEFFPGLKDSWISWKTGAEPWKLKKWKTQEEEVDTYSQRSWSSSSDRCWPSFTFVIHWSKSIPLSFLYPIEEKMTAPSKNYGGQSKAAKEYICGECSDWCM